MVSPIAFEICSSHVSIDCDCVRDHAAGLESSPGGVPFGAVTEGAGSAFSVVYFQHAVDGVPAGPLFAPLVRVDAPLRGKCPRDRTAPQGECPKLEGSHLLGIGFGYNRLYALRLCVTFVHQGHMIQPSGQV